MARKLKKTDKKKRNLLVVTLLATIVLGVSTFAWFIGMMTVTISTFDVEIAATESLLLSLDGVKWDTTVHITKDTVNEVSYPGHRNSWGNGLVPISTVGDVDRSTSRIKSFQKASLTATKGGFRIMANEIKNNENFEYDGYVVFDLFIKNFSGSKYLTEYTALNEEAVYFDYDSEVKISENGGVANTGIENAVRVAFVPVGRVPSSITDQSIITGITCGNTPGAIKTHNVGSVTASEVGICERTQIWEPNDTKHVSNAIKYYTKICKKRNGTSNSFNYTKYDCKPLVDGEYSQTYPIKKEILDSYHVDVYDGEDYNGFTGNSEYLSTFPYFRDSVNNSEKFGGDDRPEFMRLAPNSITKVRIYVYLEGQDVDTYDYAALGAKISVAFGFTKERFEEGDIEYDGPSTFQPKMNVPESAKPYRMAVGEAFDPFEVGVTATYTRPKVASDGDMEEYSKDYVLVNDDNIITVEENNVNPLVAGTYFVKYKAEDNRGNIATTTVTVIVN